MTHEFSYNFDEAFLRAALKRDMAWRGVYATLALGLVLVAGWIWAGEVSMLTVGIVVGAAVVLWALLYRTWRTASARIVELWTKQSPDRVQTFRIDDEGFEVRVGSSEMRYEWAGLRRLWRYHDVWIIEIVKNMSVFFPPDAASDDARQFIVDRCRANGVRV